MAKINSVTALHTLALDEGRKKTRPKQTTGTKFNQTSMLTDIIPKLPMRNKSLTKAFYLTNLGFEVFGDYGEYLILGKDNIEIHFFVFKKLNPKENYGQIYIRTDSIDTLYQSLLDNKTNIHPNGPLQIKAWAQKEFALLDPDNNLLTFGQSIKGMHLNG